MTRPERAIDIFKQRFNCSQALFTAFRQEDKLDEETALKLSTVFGAGVACTGVLWAVAALAVATVPSELYSPR